MRSRPWNDWAALALAILEAGYMVFDGIHAFATGDYVTPTSGAYAGRLGPWADLVSGAGIDPRSGFMKGLFVAYGVAWLAAAAWFVAHRPWSRKMMLAFAASPKFRRTAQWACRQSIRARPTSARPSLPGA